jgi:hypothetical protein
MNLTIPPIGRRGESKPRNLRNTDIALELTRSDPTGRTEGRLRQMLRGDLATIVQECLRPQAKDRYLSVDLLAADIQRHLAGRPVLARPQTTLYRCAGFVRRNRGVRPKKVARMIAERVGQTIQKG